MRGSRVNVLYVSLRCPFSANDMITKTSVRVINRSARDTTSFVKKGCYCVAYGFEARYFYELTGVVTEVNKSDTRELRCSLVNKQLPTGYSQVSELRIQVV